LIIGPRSSIREIAVILKYAGRHLLKRNPWVLGRCSELMSRETVSPHVHRARQELLLGRVLKEALRIPAYAQYAREVPEENCLAHFSDVFPIIDKTALLEYPTDFFSGGKPSLLTTVAATSGTTGTPLDIHRSFLSILWEEAFHLQHWHWAGWRRGQRQSVLRGDLVVPLERQQPPYWFNDAAGGQLVISTRHLDRQTVPLIADELRRFGASQLRAYPSAAYELATLAQEAGVPVHFTAVITGSEMLYDFQREHIERVFRCKVFDFYSMAERVTFVCECERGRMHVNPEYGVLEIVDEHGRATDNEGTIVGTSLHNSAVPLIRYRMNDTARWSHESCPCGRTYPVIEKISGRLADQLYDLDGRAVNCTVIGFAFDGMRNIQKAQVAQTAEDRWSIRIVPAAGYSPTDGLRVLNKLAAQVSARVAAQIDLVESIPALPNGKYKWVVQECQRVKTPRAPALPVIAAAC
jgi:phenylacetate-CoA ligase